jgi:hypothetical protein
MKEIRLIKQKDVQKQETVEKAVDNNLSQHRNTIEVVREWVEERRVSQKEQARQMFSALFAQPQPE